MKISENKRIIELMNQIEINNKKMRIFVISLNNDKNDKSIVESKEIICPKCYEQCRIKIDDYIINLYNCKNNHSTVIKLDNFKEFQEIDLSKIKCDDCKIKNRGNTYNNDFYTCLNCQNNLCVLCKARHNKNHIIINYDQKNFICPKHYNSFFKYCHNCNINICLICNKEHLNHNLQSFENIISSPDSKRAELDKLKNEINIFNNHVKKIISGLNQLMENMETYYKIFDNILNTLFLFSDIPSYIKKENKISKDSIYRCNYCPYTPLMKILYKGYKVYIEYRCQNGHYSYEKIYDFYQRNKFNSIDSVICSVRYEVNDGKQEFYYCNDCGKYFCGKDKMAHNENDGKPHYLINVNHINNICNEHSSAISNYCLECHKNICYRCISHSNHKKVSILNLIIKDSKLEEYRNKLNKLKTDYNNFYDECDKTIKEVLDFIDIF